MLDKSFWKSSFTLMRRKLLVEPLLEESPMELIPECQWEESTLFLCCLWEEWLLVDTCPCLWELWQWEATPNPLQATDTPQLEDIKPLLVDTLNLLQATKHLLEDTKLPPEATKLPPEAMLNPLPVTLNLQPVDINSPQPATVPLVDTPNSTLPKDTPNIPLATSKNLN